MVNSNQHEFYAEKEGKKEPKTINSIDIFKKTCPICERRHNDQGFGKACSRCWSYA